MSQFMIFLLGIDAAIVFAGLLQQKNMWAFIVAYWFILTVKNFTDFFVGRRNRNKKSK